MTISRRDPASFIKRTWRGIILGKHKDRNGSGPAVRLEVVTNVSGTMWLMCTVGGIG